MKRLVFILLLFFGLSFFGFRFIRQSVRDDLAKPVVLPSITPTPTVAKQIKGVKNSQISKSIFVPYWALPKEEMEAEDYTTFIYFGIKPGNSGIDKDEEGFKNIDKFLSTVPDDTDKKLTVRMIDSTQNFAILKDQSKQNSVIKDSIKIAKDHGFSGIVLDLEVSAAPFDSLINQINSFTEKFYKETKKQKLKFGLMFYGDTFYRLRPFDIKTLSRNADDFMIMSYDFSKSRGNPGPNFPLRGKEAYGYDMTKMIDEFLKYLPHEKTSIVFGLFGYDWTVGAGNQPESAGSAKTYKEIKKEFLSGCDYKDCDIKRKNDSVETQITYTDDNKKHVLWFEDPESVKKKQDFLREKGISNFSFWAYSYF